MDLREQYAITVRMYKTKRNINAAVHVPMANVE